MRRAGADENRHQRRDTTNGGAFTKSLKHLALFLHITAGSQVCQ